MDRVKKIGILLAVFVVVCAAAFGVSKYEEKKEQIKNSEEIILEIDPETVSKLTWKNEEGTFSFHRKEKWQYDDDEAFPVDSDKLKDMLKTFESFGVSFVIESVEDYAQYGLDEPTCKINFTAGDTDYEVSIGNFSAMDSERYVSIGDGKVYLVKNDPMNQYKAVLSDVIDHDKPLSYDKIKKIAFSGAENQSIVYQEESKASYCKDDVYFQEKEAGNLPLDTSRIDGYLRNIRQMNLKDYVTYNVMEKELTDYGLNDPELTVTVDYTYKEPVEGTEKEKKEEEEKEGRYVLQISRSPEDKKKTSAAALLEEADRIKEEKKEKEKGKEKQKEQDIKAYVRIGDSQIVYEVKTAEYLNMMRASYDELRHREVFTGDLKDVTQMDISMEDKDYAFTSEGKDEERIWRYQDREVPLADFKAAVEGLKADSFTGESPTEKREISLTFHLDNEDFPQVQVELYRYNGTHCLAVIDGKSTSLIPRSAVVELMEAVNAIVLNRDAS